MSAATCCYCGGPTVYPHCEPGIDAERGYHDACHPSHGEWRFPGVLRAEYAALAGAHDASVAEYQAQLAERDAVIRRGIYALMGPRNAALERAASVWEQRALAAETQLAAARADGARSMAAMIALRQGRRALPIENQIAAWQAAQTEG